MSLPNASSQSTITLKGSTKIVAEFFDYAINSILYQRGIYPPDEFEGKKKYGLTVLVTKDADLRAYLNQALGQLASWLLTGDVRKLVLVVSDRRTREPKERWNFDVQMDVAQAEAGSEKPQAEIAAEIRTIIRQITSSVTYLPLLEHACTFELLIYTADDTRIPTAWEESPPYYLANSDSVKLHSFSTKIHSIDSLVAFEAAASSEDMASN